MGLLFQMCYGPEIRSMFECLKNEPGLTTSEIKEKYQYNTTGDVKSLVDGVFVFLKELEFIEQKEDKNYITTSHWSTVEMFRRLNGISTKGKEETLNYVFSSLYETLFVKPDKLFISNLHYHVNSNYGKTMVGIEKVNAWKRIMECYGLGRRVYTGFYALPRLDLLVEIINEIGIWEGPLHQYCEKFINPVIPCITTERNVYRGLLYGLNALHEKGTIMIKNKQDLPYKSYGQEYNWNWIITKVEGA